MLKRERERVAAALKTVDDRTWDHRDERRVPKKGVSRQSSSSSTHGESSEHQSQTTLEERGQPEVIKEEASEGHNRKKISHSKQLADDMSQGRREAFEVFRSDYPHNAAIEENKRTLKQRYSEAKALGEQVNNSRKRINTLKTQIEQHRIRRSMHVNGDEDDIDEEDRLRNSIEEEKSRYKDAFTRLRSLKTEIEHLQHLLEKSKVQMQKDFEAWWAEQSSLPHRAQNGKPTHEMKTAWKTPTPPLSPIKSEDHRPRSSTDPRQRLSQDNLRSSDILSSRLQTEVRLSSFPSSSGTLDSSTGSNSAHQDRTSEMPVRDSPRHHNNRREIKDAYESAKRLNSSNASNSLKLTGDSRADEDILAFIRARQTLLDQKGSNQR